MAKKNKFNAEVQNRAYGESVSSRELSDFLQYRLLNGWTPQRPSGETTPLITPGSMNPKTDGIHYMDIGRHDFFNFDRNGSDNQGILNALFEQLLHYDHASDEFQREDFANLIDWYKMLNQRNYDETRTDEQRKYDEKWYFEQLNDIRNFDDPNNQLARLMQTGMSRQQAQQLLSGSPSSSPVSATQPVSGLTPTPTSAKVDGTAQQMQKVQLILSVFNALASFGTSAVAAGATSSLQSAAAQSQNMANMAQQKSAAFNSVIHRAQRRGLIDKNLSFDDAISALEASDDPDIKEFVNSGAIDDLTSTAGAYQIASENYNMRFGNTNEFLQQEFLRNQLRLAQIDVESSASDLERTLLDNEQFMQFAPYLHQKDILQVQDDINMLAESSSPAELKKRLDYMRSHNSTLAYLSLVDSMQAKSLFDVYKDNPIVRPMITTAAVMDKLGLTGIVGEAVRTVVYGSSALESIGNLQNEQSQPANNNDGELSPLGQECEPEVSKLKKGARMLFKQILNDIRDETQGKVDFTGSFQGAGGSW